MLNGAGSPTSSSVYQSLSITQPIARGQSPRQPFESIAAGPCVEEPACYERIPSAWKYFALTYASDTVLVPTGRQNGQSRGRLFRTGRCGFLGPEVDSASPKRTRCGTV